MSSESAVITVRKEKVDYGFSLLETIFVLAVLGIILLGVGTYIRKAIDEHTRQSQADAVARDISGLLQFVNADSIASVVNDKKKSIVNPLYQQPGDVISDNEDIIPNDPNLNIKGLQHNPIYKIHGNDPLDVGASNYSPYLARVYSVDPQSPVSNGTTVSANGRTYHNRPLEWTLAVRQYFTDSACVSTSDKVYFTQPFLSCNENPVLRNAEIDISRVDLVNDAGAVSRPTAHDQVGQVVPVGINRVDIYVSFHPVDSNPAHLYQFVTPLMNAFQAQKITPDPDSIYLTEKTTGNNAWTFLQMQGNRDSQGAFTEVTGLAPVTTAVSDANSLARVSDIPLLTGMLNKNAVYALRFTFSGKGDYLRTDGLNSATKICWNAKNNKQGPCLEAPSQDLLVLHQRNQPNTLADMQMRNVILQGKVVINSAGGQKTLVDGYYTAPQIWYASFSNKGLPGQIDAYYRNPATPDGDDLCTAPDACGLTGPTVADVENPLKGAISVPVQTCPVVPGFTRTDSSVPDPDDPDKPHRLYPRLSVSTSSVMSGLKINSAGQEVPGAKNEVFLNQGQNLSAMSQSGIPVNRLGGVVLQARKDITSNTWRISSMVATEATTVPGNSWQYYNPVWLSVVVSTWCSSVPQT
ncbi:TPA: type II secretion system protein [Salmonella enterica subsp. enterica serovar Concord]|nr:type II secretion system protein [Salmonella enterica subsp. enterica serovar Concord]